MGRAGPAPFRRILIGRRVTSIRRFRFDIPSDSTAIAVVALILIAGAWAYTIDRGRSERIEAAAAGP